MLIISKVLETPVSTLLGENISESKVDDLKAISEKLEIINLQLSQELPFIRLNGYLLG